MAVVVYLVAGLAAAWALPGRWWQRLLLIVLWFPMVLYGVCVEVVEWFQRHGYHYPTDEEWDEESQGPAPWSSP